MVSADARVQVYAPSRLRMAAFAGCSAAVGWVVALVPWWHHPVPWWTLALIAWAGIAAVQQRSRYTIRFTESSVEGPGARNQPTQIRRDDIDVARSTAGSVGNRFGMRRVYARDGRFVHAWLPWFPTAAREQLRREVDRLVAPE